ncbi:MAG: PAS domain S-box protein [Nostoc sp. TH1S01]|nr:PAS domain S-box protein [Nostoc sp. TH1S01]
MEIYARLLPYCVAIGTTAIALVLRLWLQNLLPETLGGFFYIAILISTWYGGFRPGIVAVVLSTLAVEYFLLYPRYQFSLLQPQNLLQLSLFILVALIINLLTSNFLASKHKIQQLSQKLAQENAEQLKMALSAAQMGMWNWDMVTGEIEWSPEHEQLFGLAVGSFDGRYETFAARVHMEDHPDVEQAIQQSLQTQSIYQQEYRIVWADGTIHWVEGRGQAFYNAVGGPVRMTGTVMAIDERKQAQITLQQQFEQQRLVMEMSQRIRSSINIQEILQTTVNEVRQFLQCDRVIIFQFASDGNGTVVIESVGANWTAILSSNIYDPCFSTYIEPFKQGLVTAKSDIYTAGIDACHVELLASFQVRANLVVPILNQDELWGLLIAHHCETPREWQSTEIDLLRQLGTQLSIALQQAELFEQLQTQLQERQKAELALQQLNAELEQKITQRTAQLAQTNARLIETVIDQQHTQLILLEQAQLLDLAHDMIVTRDLNGAITFWNEGAEYMYGWTKAEALGQILHNLLKTQFSQPLTEIETQLLENGYWEGELIHFRRDGQPVTVASRWVLQKDNANRAIKILEINNDITERKQAEKILQQYERIVSNIQDGIALLNRDYTYQLVNQTYLDWYNKVDTEVLGHSVKEILGQQLFDSFIQPRLDRCLAGENIQYARWFDYPNRPPQFMSVTYTPYREQDETISAVIVSLRDITRLQKAEAALRHSEERFRQLAENIQAVFWMTDIDNQQVLYVSPAYETIWQRSCESLYQNSSAWLDAIHPDDRPLAEMTFNEQLIIEKADIKYRIIRPDGSMCWIRDRAFPIKNELGEIVRIAGLAEDITELQQIEQMKSEFIGIVSHELRTPLTAIRAAMGLLKSGIYDSKPDKFKRMIEIAAIDSDRLVRLVNDILDLERLESGRPVLEKTICNAADLIEQAVAGVQAIAKEQNIKFDIQLTDVRVWAAADAIIQTLTNLLGNAIKFSPADATISLRVHQQTDHVLFEIRDQGRGIPSDKLEAIFGRFQQVDASDSRSKDGTGLGLAICRSIIDLHGGKIWAESTVGVGSVFFFTLPINRE